MCSFLYGSFWVCRRGVSRLDSMKVNVSLAHVRNESDIRGVLVSTSVVGRKDMKIFLRAGDSHEAGTVVLLRFHVHARCHKWMPDA